MLLAIITDHTCIALHYTAMHVIAWHCIANVHTYLQVIYVHIRYNYVQTCIILRVDRLSAARYVTKPEYTVEAVGNQSKAGGGA